MKKLQSLSRLTNRVKYWLVMVLASAVLVGFSYLAVQQNYRHNANDPQIQYAQDIASALEQGASPEALGGNNPVDPRKSLGLFLVVTDENQKVLASSLQLDGKDTPVPGKGSFESVKNGGQNRFTWAPSKDARVAAVVQHYKGQKPGYILVGRSVKEVEKRTMELGLMALGAFLALVALTTLAARIGMAPVNPKKVTAAPLEPLAFEEAGTSPAKTEETSKADKEATKKPAPKRPATKSTKAAKGKKTAAKKSTRS